MSADRVLVDSNVIVDVLSDDPVWRAWSSRHLAEALDAGAATINFVVYSEISRGFETPTAADDALPRGLRREPIPFEAAFLAARALEQYRRRGGSRRTPLPDFYIGAHAQVAGMRLLTRDVQRYRTYFPEVELIAPPEEADPTVRRDPPSGP